MEALQQNVWQGRRARRVALEALLVVSVYQTYKWVRLMTREQYSAAVTNAGRVVRWERALGGLVEDDLQRMALRSPELIWVLNRYYTYMHFAATVTFLIWLYVRHADAYLRVRRVLVATTLLSLPVHLLFPLAPPRMLSQLGFVDTISRFGPRIYDDPDVAGVVNQIAAMPSLHFGWALIVGWAIVRTLRHRLRWVAAAHPVITLCAIVLTANHWWLDAAVAAVMVVAVARADAWARSRVEPASRPERGERRRSRLDPRPADPARRPRAQSPGTWPVVAVESAAPPSVAATAKVCNGGGGTVDVLVKDCQRAPCGQAPPRRT